MGYGKLKTLGLEVDTHLFELALTTITKVKGV